MTRLTRKSVLLVGVETTPGVPVAAGAAMRISDLSLTPVAAEGVERNFLRPHLGATQRLLGAPRVETTFTVELAGSGAAAKPPAWGPLLRACGFAETVVAGGDARGVHYAPTSEGGTTLTMHVHRDGTLHRISSARGSASMTFEPNAIPTMVFRFVGTYETPSAVADPKNIDYSAFAMPLLPNAKVAGETSVHGADVVASSFEVDLGVTAEMVSFLSRESVEITARDVSGSMSIRDDGFSQANFFDKAATSSLGGLVHQHGASAGSIVRIEAPKVQIVDPGYGDRNGVQTLSLGLRFVPDEGDDEIAVITR